MPEYSKEKLWKIYELLPEELKEAIFSVETADTIYDVCTKNGIEDNRISEVARYAGHVLLGVLLPEEFQETLEKKVKLKKTVAKKIAQEIYRYVFFPVKASLDQLGQAETPTPPKAEAPAGETERLKPREPETAKEKPKKEDVYREPVE